MNFQIWRAKEGEFVLIGCSLTEDAYISISGIWGIQTKKRIESEHAVFEDESAEGGTDYYYCTGKGKNWPKFISLCPELKDFEFWDENKGRLGTLEQEQFLFCDKLKNAHFTECLQSLRVQNLDNVEIAKTTGTIFPPHYKSSVYTYGTLMLSLPLPDTLKLQLKQLAQKEKA